MIKHPERPTQHAKREKLLVKYMVSVVVSLSGECWHWYALWTYKEVKWPQGVIMTISSSNPPLSFSNLNSQYTVFILSVWVFWMPASSECSIFWDQKYLVLANHLITAINYWLMWSFKFLWIQRFILRSLGTDKEGGSKQELSQIIINCLPGPT